MEFSVDEGESILSGALIKDRIVFLQPSALMKRVSHLPAQLHPQEK